MFVLVLSPIVQGILVWIQGIVCIIIIIINNIGVI